MKRKIYLASHGTLSHGLEDSAKMICGNIPYSIEAFALQPGMSPESFANIIKKSIKLEPRTEHIILTDLFGASVFNSMYPLTTNTNVFLFSGMNLNSLLSICIEHPEPLTKKSAADIVRIAREGIKFIEFSEPQEENF